MLPRVHMWLGLRLAGNVILVAIVFHVVEANHACSLGVLVPSTVKTTAESGLAQHLDNKQWPASWLACS